VISPYFTGAGFSVVASSVIGLSADSVDDPPRTDGDGKALPPTSTLKVTWYLRGGQTVVYSYDDNEENWNDYVEWDEQFRARLDAANK